MFVAPTVRSCAFDSLALSRGAPIGEVQERAVLLRRHALRSLREDVADK